MTSGVAIGYIAHVTKAEYKSERKRRGTQKQVAALLGVSRVSISRRETGTRPVMREAWLALMALPNDQDQAQNPRSKTSNEGAEK